MKEGENVKKAFILLQVAVVFAVFMLVPLSVSKQNVKALGLDTAVKVVAGSQAERVLIAVGEKAGARIAGRTSQQIAIQRWNLQAYQAAVDAGQIEKANKLAAFVDEANKAQIIPIPDKPGFGKIVISTVGFLTGLDMVVSTFNAIKDGYNAQKTIAVMDQGGTFQANTVYQSYKSVNYRGAFVNDPRFSTDQIYYNDASTQGWTSISTYGLNVFAGPYGFTVKDESNVDAVIHVLYMGFDGLIHGAGDLGVTTVNPSVASPDFNVPLVNAPPLLSDPSPLAASAVADPVTAGQNLGPNMELTIPLDDANYTDANSDFGNVLMPDPMVAPSPAPAPDPLPTDVLGWLQKLWETLKQILDNLLSLLQNLGTWFASIIAKLISILDLLNQLFSSLGNWFQSIINALSGLPNLIASALSSLFQSIVNALSGLPSLIASAFQSLFQSILDLLNSIWSGITNLPNAIASSIAALFMPSIDPAVQFNPVVDSFKGKFNNPSDFAYLNDHVFSNQCQNLNNIQLTLFGVTVTAVDFTLLKVAATWWLPIMKGFIWFLFGWWAYKRVVDLFKRSGQI